VFYQVPEHKDSIETSSPVFNYFQDSIGFPTKFEESMKRKSIGKATWTYFRVARHGLGK
jgi:hypothetical protein